jgi:ubiquinone/menaquinone biosynthesis C-methylase UbiE
MTDYNAIYDEQAGKYERLVAHEDYQQNLLPALQRIRSLEGLEVVELGAGTGRMTCLLAPLVKSIQAYDISDHMLEVAAGKLAASRLQNWRTGIADHRELPVDDESADLAIAGWTICYTAIDYEETWKQELERALDEMKRVLRPGGTIIILETLGTGHSTPTPPDDMKTYLAFLEVEAGFSSAWIRTDYLFASLDEAREVTSFFFGESMVENAVGTDPVILPECTGIWWLHV